MIKSRRMTWTVYVERLEERNAYKILMWKPEGKRPLGRPRPRRVCVWTILKWILEK
jgi:hypothetical protein